MPPEETPPRLRLTVGPWTMILAVEAQAAPISAAALLAALPLDRSLLQARWSGQSGWAPLAPIDLRLPPENATCYPRPGEILLYAGDLSEPELLVAYGPTAFASKAGPLAGNHVLTIVDGAEHLPAIGEALVWKGALPLRLERA